MQQIYMAAQIYNSSKYMHMHSNQHIVTNRASNVVRALITLCPQV